MTQILYTIETTLFFDMRIPGIEELSVDVPGIRTNIINAMPMPGSFTNVDIAIVTNPTNVDLKDIRKEIKDGELILCLDLNEENTLSEEDIKLLDDIWIIPASLARMEKRLTNILLGIRKNQESLIHMSWLDALMDTVPDMIWVKSLDGIHWKVNQAFCKMAGKTKRMIEGKKHSAIWGGDDNACAESENQVIRSKKSEEFEEILVIENKKYRLQTFKAPFFGPNNEILGTLGVAHDITNLMNLSNELEIFIEAMPFPLILVKENEKITHVNEKFLEIFNEKREDLVDTNYPDWAEWAFEPFHAGPDMDAMRFKHKNEKLLVAISSTPLKDIFGNIIGTVYAFRDVTAEKELEAYVWKTANEDALTGLANRHALSGWIKKRDKEEEQPLHLLYVDLDNFKKVNDLHGHKAGDEVLKHIAQMIRKIFPEDFAVRLGGDEFLICVSRNINLDTLTKMSNELQTELKDWFKSSEIYKEISLSIGIRANCDQKTPIDQLIREADSAMYNAKHKGKAQSVVWDENGEQRDSSYSVPPHREEK